MKHSLLGTRRIILSIITGNFFVIRIKQPMTIGTNGMRISRRQLLQHLVLSTTTPDNSFRSMCQSGRMKGFEKCFKVEDQCNILRPPAKRIQINFYERHFEPFGERKIPPSVNELHLGKEKPVMGNIEPLLGITKPAEGLNKLSPAREM